MSLGLFVAIPLYPHPMVVHIPTSVPSSRLKKAYLMRRVGARVGVRVGVGVRMRGGGPGCVHDMYRVRGARHDDTEVDEDDLSHIDIKNILDPKYHSTK